MHPSKQLEVRYTVIPPDDLDSAIVTFGTTTVPARGEQSFYISPPSSSSHSPTATYYETASSVLKEVQQSLNEQLTAWKNAIGDREKHKEDLGKVEYGQGRAMRMSASSGTTGVTVEADEAVEEADDEEKYEDEE